MLKLITGVRKIFRKKGEDSLQSLSIAKVSGFRICRTPEKEQSKIPLDRRAPKEIFYSRETR